MLYVILLLILAVLLFGSAAIFGGIAAAFGSLALMAAIATAAWLSGLDFWIVFVAVFVALLPLSIWLERSVKRDKELHEDIRARAAARKAEHPPRLKR